MLSTMPVDNIAVSVDNFQNCNVSLGTFTYCIKSKHAL